MSDIKIKKPHLIHKRFKLPKGNSVKSFVLREIDGADEREAGRWIAARGDVDDTGLVIMEEQMRVAIVAVDDKPVEQPYTDMNQWSTKTRRFLLEGFGMLNGVEDDELAVFRGAATDLMGDQAEAEEVSEEEIALAKQQG